MTVQVIRDQDVTCAGGDFLRVYCQRRDGLTGHLCHDRAGVRWRDPHADLDFRTLLSGEPMDEEVATQFAEAYAERKNIPVVYVEVV